MFRLYVLSIVCLCVLLTSTIGVFAQDYKRLPPDGIHVDDATKQLLGKRTKDLRTRSVLLANSVGDREQWLPDIEVLIRAVDLALELNGFFRERELNDANALLDEAERRLEAVARGARGLQLLGITQTIPDSATPLIGGYRSKIDDSVQPYGVVLPSGFDIKSNELRRLDVWLHGRGDSKTEIAFLTERKSKAGQYTPKDTLVLHPFGRHCNAFKFAGETDVAEAINHVKSLFNVHPSQTSIRGFSMGGAGCWHLAVHQPCNWFAANPGAGFVDTIVYQGWKDSTPFPITKNRRKLLNWYDVLPWVGNLRNLPTVAYSGEVDKQRQAADRVVERAEELKIKIDYVIGAKMGHKIDPPSLEKIGTRLADLAKAPIQSPRKNIDFTTYTLRYSEADWLQITGLKEHWTLSRIQASIENDHRVNLITNEITRVKLDFHKSGWPIDSKPVTIAIDGISVKVRDWSDAPGLQVELQKAEQWEQIQTKDSAVRKRPGIQGPIDDAFCDRFLFVAPSQRTLHSSSQRWIEREFEYAKKRWQKLMRGEIRVIRDDELTEAMIRDNHLICFGDFNSNAFLKDVHAQLPIKWEQETITVGDYKAKASHHAVAMCYPNPKNPEKYLVINSGMTFREFSNVSNSRQIAMLPDWAIINTDKGDDGIFAGEIVQDGFFDEQWQVK